MDEIRSLFFNSLLHWLIAIDFNGMDFHDFLVSLN